MANIQERQSKSGQSRFRVQIRVKGAKPVSRTFSRKTDAKKWASETERDIESGLYSRVAEAKKHTVSEAIDRHIRDVVPQKPKSGTGSTQHLNQWKIRIGHCSLADVSTPLLVQNRDELKSEVNARGEQRSPATVNRYLTSP